MDAALELHQERLAIFETLGDEEGIANTLWSMGSIQVKREDFEGAFRNVAESYAILLQLGRLDGVCVVGLDLGQLLCYYRQVEEALVILTRSRDGFLKLGWAGMARRAEDLVEWCRELGEQALRQV